MTLKDFYRSNEWESLRKVVIAQKTDSETGFVFCALCGKPILNKYDLIVHHKEALTDANVNDALISLNPDNMECVHFKCHNKIHERFGYGTHERPPRKVYIVYGAPCSGKTKFVNDNAGLNDLIIDIDNLYSAISNNPRYLKPDSLRGVVFGIRDHLYDTIKYRRGDWRNAYVITGGARSGDRARLMRRINADEFIFIEASKEECLMRAVDRPKDWINFINEWFETYQPD